MGPQKIGVPNIDQATAYARVMNVQGLIGAKNLQTLRLALTRRTKMPTQTAYLD